MKKTLLIIGVVLFTTTARAGDTFGASLKPSPNFTLFGQNLSWPIPSLCVGAKAGVTPDVQASSEGIKFKIPYFALEIPFPTLTVGTKDKKIALKLGEIVKSEQK